MWTLTTVGSVATISKRVRTDSWPWPLVFAALMFSMPVRSNILFGQISVILAALVIAAMDAEAPVRYGCLAGIAAGIKLTPAVFLPFAVGRDPARRILVAIASFSFSMVVAFLVMRGDTDRYVQEKVWSSSEIPSFSISSNQSLLAALTRLSFQGSTLRSIWAVTLLALAVPVAVRARKALRNRDWKAVTIILGSYSLIGSPISWTHHQIWLALVPWAIGDCSKRVRLSWLAACVATVWSSIPHITVSGTAVTALNVLIDNQRLLLAVGVCLALPIAVRDTAESSDRVHEAL